MRGEVLYYDEAQGFGFIHGADGNRYTFARENLRRDAVMAKGTQVEFKPDGNQARDIFSIRAAPTSVPSVSSALQGGEPFQPVTEPSLLDPIPAPATPPLATMPPSHFGRAAETSPAQPTDSWGIFWQTLTRNYFNFQGRARRKEYWIYALFWIVCFIMLFGIGLVLDNAAGSFQSGDAFPVIATGLAVTFILVTVFPSAGLVVRRLHDIGLPGWLCLLAIIPTLGWILMLIFGLVPSQAQENRWGPGPPAV